MRIAICDDNADDRIQIRDLLQEHFDTHGYTGEFHLFSSGEDLLESFTPYLYDIVFLDVYMNGIDGMETAGQLRQIDPDFALVFITVSRDHAMESFSHRPIYYLTKPVRHQDVDNAFRQCRGIFLKNARYVEIISNRIKTKIPLTKIMFLEAYGKEVIIHMADGSMKSRTTLDVLAQDLNSTFLRCHRSYIINFSYTSELKKNGFLMQNGTIVPMRQRGRTELRNAYADFMCSRLFEALP